MEKKYSVKICANFDAYYYAFYVLGIMRFFKNEQLSFTNRDSQGLPSDCFAFVTAPRVRFFIDARDTSSIDLNGAAWCSVYGKVNYSSRVIPADLFSKIKPIGPNFGIRLWSVTKAFFLAFNNFLICRKEIKDIRTHFANYWRQYRYRVSESHYVYKPPQNDYIFSLNSIWKDDIWTNQLRNTFFKCCRSINDIDFEGGFAPRTNIRGYEQFTVSKRYEITEYLEKTKSSFVVFNTPAVKKCLGWKLGEYLALGKAIISIPLEREMPVPLIHGKHVHFVDGKEVSILEAINLIHKNKEYRENLEINAREYYLSNLCPERVIERLVLADKV